MQDFIRSVWLIFIELVRVFRLRGYLIGWWFFLSIILLNYETCILSITRGTLSSIKDSLDAKLSAIKPRVRTVYWLYFLAGCAAHHGRYRDLKWSLTVHFICVPLSPDFRNFETTSKPGVVALLTRDCQRPRNTFANMSERPHKRRDKKLINTELQ